MIPPVLVELVRATVRRQGRLDIRVLLDGEDVTASCYAADARRGLVLCFARDDQGRPQMDPTRPDRLVRSARRGKVRILAMVGPWHHDHAH